MVLGLKIIRFSIPFPSLKTRIENIDFDRYYSRQIWNCNYDTKTYISYTTTNVSLYIWHKHKCHLCIYFDACEDCHENLSNSDHMIIGIISILLHSCTRFGMIVRVMWFFWGVAGDSCGLREERCKFIYFHSRMCLDVAIHRTKHFVMFWRI